jgi:tight adherence protein B
VAAIKAFGSDSQSALYDALSVALTQKPAAGAHQIAVLFSDGGDTASTATLDTTTAALAAAQVPLYAAELHASESSQGALAQLTAASGGRVVTAEDPAAVADALAAFAQQLGRQYAVTYSSAGHGATDVDLVVQATGVRATARTHLDLPAAAAPAPPATVDPAATRPAGRSPVVGGWALVVGSGLCGIALLGLLLGYASSRTPRARGLATPRRGNGMEAFTDRAESVGDALLKRQGGVSAVSAVLELAGVDIRPGELLLGVTAGAALLFAAGWFLVSPLLGLGLALMVPVGVRVVLRFLAARRRRRFTDQMAETLQILAGTLRAGHGLAQAIDTVAREAESPTAEEFRRLTIETRLGRDFVDALGSVAERVGSEDFEWVVQAVQIQREVGGDLASILDTVASTVRDRTRIRRQVSALSAEGRMSAWVLMVLPFGLGGMMAITNRAYLSPLFGTGTGLRLLGVGAVLLAIGGAWLRRIVKPIF